MKPQFVSILLMGLAVQEVSAQAPASDTLFHVLQTELRSNMQQLQQQEQKPYFMSYTVSETDNTFVNATMGLLQNMDGGGDGTRLLSVQIRLGDTEKDNFKYGAGWETSEVLPLENHAVEATREAIWKQTLTSYKSAESRYASVLSEENKVAAREDTSGCFTIEDSIYWYEDPIVRSQRQLDVRLWAARLCEVTAVFREYHLLDEGSASLNSEYSRTYHFNTEGTAVVQNRLATRIFLQASASTPEGIPLSLSKDYFSYSFDQLPDVEVMKADARDLAERIIALRNAPIADPYTGPALLSGPASGVFFHEIFGHRLESHRLKEGGETFRKMVGQRVLPKEFNVYCDPTLRALNGQDLNGYYRYDDEGVQARRVNNVVNGVLRDFLVSRTPMDGYTHSNGHGRCQFSNTPVSRQSNLVVETSQPCTEAKLRQMLVKEAKRQGREYGYYIRSVTGGYTYTGEGFVQLNAFSVQPVEAYRIYVDGRPDELVRCVELIGTPLSMFSNITAGGDQVSTFTGYCGAESGWVPVSASSPMIFVSKVETQRSGNSERRPVSPLPPLPLTRQPSQPSDDVVWSAMQDEMQRSLDSMMVEGAKPPFLMSYTYSHGNNYAVAASLGGLLQQRSDSIVSQAHAGTSVFMGDYKLAAQANGSAVLSSTPDYSELRRIYADIIHTAYRNALGSYVEKVDDLRRHPRNAEDAAIPYLYPMDACEYIETDSEESDWEREMLGGLVRRMSAVFLDYPQLRETYVLANAKVESSYTFTSEHHKIKRVKKQFVFDINASVHTVLGKDVADSYTVYCHSQQELEDEATLLQHVRQLAERLLSEREAIINDEYYRGPVLYEGCVSGSSLTGELMSDYLRATSLPTDGYYGDYVSKSDKVMSMIGQRIIDPNLSVLCYSHMPEYNGVPLMGNWIIDEDGVEPEAQLTLIDHGVLQHQISSRYPGRKSPKSTGHNHSEPLSDYASYGILHLKAHSTIPFARMKQQLLDMAKAQGKAYAYIMRQPLGYNMCQLLRVDVNTGVETPVHTGQASSIDVVNKLYRVDYLSTEEIVQNSSSSTLIYPAAFIMDNVEVVGKAPRPAVPEPVAHPFNPEP